MYFQLTVVCTSDPKNCRDNKSNNTSNDLRFNTNPVISPGTVLKYNDLLSDVIKSNFKTQWDSVLAFVEMTEHRPVIIPNDITSRASYDGTTDWKDTYR